MNSENLIPVSERTPEELREMTSKGGHASVAARRKKRDIKLMIAAGLEAANKFVIDQLKKELNQVDSQKREEIQMQINILENGGIEVLSQIKILLSNKTSAGSKTMAANFLVEHEHGKAKQKTELSGENGAPLIMRQIIDDIPPAKRIENE